MSGLCLAHLVQRFLTSFWFVCLSFAALNVYLMLARPHIPIPWILPGPVPIPIGCCGWVGVQRGAGWTRKETKWQQVGFPLALLLVKSCAYCRSKPRQSSLCSRPQHVWAAGSFADETQTQAQQKKQIFRKSLNHNYNVFVPKHVNMCNWSSACIEHMHRSVHAFLDCVCLCLLSLCALWLKPHLSGLAQHMANWACSS